MRCLCLNKTKTIDEYHCIAYQSNVFCIAIRSILVLWSCNRQTTQGFLPQVTVLRLMIQ
jgi:hypothetical protein